jgi:hypothetical protein
MREEQLREEAVDMSRGIGRLWNKDFLCDAKDDVETRGAAR